MLLNSLTPPDTVPTVSASDLRDVSDARAEALNAWDARLESIFSEYQNHPQRLRPLRTAMEERLLRAFAGLINQLRQEDLGIEQYIWRSQDDAKVRDSHAGYDDQVFRWDDPPVGGHPGEAQNCRCYAEPIATAPSKQRSSSRLRRQRSSTRPFSPRSRRGPHHCTACGEKRNLPNRFSQHAAWENAFRKPVSLATRDVPLT